MYNVTYLSQDADSVQQKTGLSLDELELLVGRFKAHSSRAGRLRGELRVYADRSMEIWKHFPRKRLWSSYE